MTIAYKLQTIAEYDKVIVLDSSVRVIEQGAVGDLLKYQGGGAFFCRLCADSGDPEAIENSAKRDTVMIILMVLIAQILATTILVRTIK